MKIEFDTSRFLTTEFGVGQRVGAIVRYSLFNADNTVKDALRGEVEAMLTGTAKEITDPPHYDPAEQYGNSEYLVLPLRHELATSLAELHETDILALSSFDLQLLRNSFCYFMRGTDKSGRRLTALNRAAQLKATLGKQGRLMTWIADTLQVISDPVMQLNSGFDIVIDSAFIHIFHPASFRILANVDEAVAKAVPRNIKALSQAAHFVEWLNIGEYATRHPRAASLLASIRTKGYAENLDKARLESLCKVTDVVLDTSQEFITVPDGQILPFLEVLDRRRYEIDLVPDTPEQYKASSRTEIGRGGT